MGLLLDKLPKLLEVRVSPQEVQACEGVTATATTTTTTFASLGSGFKHVETTIIATGCRWSGGRVNGGGTGLRLLLRRRLLLLLLLLGGIGETLI